MKKGVILTALGVLVVVAGGAIVLRTIPATETSASANVEVSAKSAKSLQSKIDKIKKAHAEPGRPREASRVVLSEAELESYVLYSLVDSIPARLDSIQIQLATNTVASDTQMTFGADSTGNAVVDALIGGTHKLFLKGKLVGEEGRGKFDLEEVRVDSIPVPKSLVETLLEKYVKPTYPEADLTAPFDLPWGIEQLKLEPGYAMVVY